MGGIAHYGWCWRESHAYLCMCVHYSLLDPYPPFPLQHVHSLLICHPEVGSSPVNGLSTMTHSCGWSTVPLPSSHAIHTRAHTCTSTNAGLINWTASRDTNAQCDKHWSWCSAHITNRCSSAPTSLFSNDLPGLDTKGPVHCKTTEINPYPAIRYWPTLASSVTVPQLRLYNTLHTVWNDSSS